MTQSVYDATLKNNIATYTILYHNIPKGQTKISTSTTGTFSFCTLFYNVDLSTTLKLLTRKNSLEQ